MTQDDTNDTEPTSGFDPLSTTDHDECEGCGDSQAPTRAIRMRQGRTQRLCQNCFEAALADDMVHPSDPRLDGGTAK